MSESGYRDCPFCRVESSRVVAANDLAFVVRDQYPVSPGHSLVIPKRHVADWWSTAPQERAAIDALVDTVKEGLDREFSPAGYNVGFNDRAAGGQTVFHLHVHVIPRFDGDVDDPRGGMRHVLPARANYMLEPESDEGLDSPIESRLGETIDSSALIQRVLAVLDEGRRSATYKPALLLALVELAVERVDGLAALELPLADIADKVMELYWPQTRPHDAAEGTLRQATTRASRIVDALTELRSSTRAAVNQPLGQLRTQHPNAYLGARSRIARALAMQPIPRLQRPGSGIGGAYPRFLFDDRDYATEAGWQRPGEQPHVRLLPGVADALARSAPLLRIATQDVWVRDVAAINRMHTQEQQLRSFLFGADRVALRSVADGLRDLGVRHCFWCEKPLRGATDVDHVIPWSHYPNDDLFNLVLADRVCNNNKRDRLVTAQLVERWVQRDHELARSLADELKWPFDPQRSGQVARSAYRYLPEGMPVWAGRDRLEVFRPDDRGRIDAAVGLLAVVGS